MKKLEINAMDIVNLKGSPLDRIASNNEQFSTLKLAQETYDKNNEVKQAVLNATEELDLIVERQEKVIDN